MNDGIKKSSKNVLNEKTSMYFNLNNIPLSKFFNLNNN